VTPGNSAAARDDRDTMQRWTRAAAAGALGLVVTMFLPAAPALAHTSLRASTPAANSSVHMPISFVQLTFSSAPTQPSVTVTGTDGQNASRGTAQVDGVVVKQPVGTLPSGAVTVKWRVVSPDGDPVEGTFKFTNAVTGATPDPSKPPAGESTQRPSTGPTTATDPATATTSATASSAPAVDAAPRSADDGGVSPLWWVGAGIVLLAAVGGGALWMRRRRRA
jgi:copper resistance protein C